MVGKVKTQSLVYNHINTSDERCCSSGRSRGSMKTRQTYVDWRTDVYDKQDEEETYSVVLNNGDTITKTYTPYRSKWRQRKDARRKNAEEFLNGEQTEGSEFLKDNNIKVKKIRQAPWKSKGTVGPGWKPRGSHQGFKPANSRESYEQVDEVSEKAVVQ